MARSDLQSAIDAARTSRVNGRRHKRLFFRHASVKMMHDDSSERTEHVYCIAHDFSFCFAQ